MIIIKVKEEESIARALKRYKRKFRNTQTMKELRRRREFVEFITVSGIDFFCLHYHLGCGDLR